MKLASLYLLLFLPFIAGCSSVEGNFREGNPLRNPPENTGIFVTQFNVRTPYRTVGVVEVKAFPGMFSPPLTEEDMYRELAKLAGQQKEKVDAIVQVQIQPYNTPLQRRGLMARGMAVRYLATAQGSISAEEYFLHGWRAIREERYDDAVVDFLHVLQIDPLMIDAHFNLAQLYYDRGEYDKALEHINMFLRYNRMAPQNERALALRDDILTGASRKHRASVMGKAWSGTKAVVNLILTPIATVFGM